MSSVSATVWAGVDPEAEAYTQRRIRYWDGAAKDFDHRTLLRSYYQRQLQRTYAGIVPPRSRVLEIGCAEGDLLASLRPSYGVGVDFAPTMIERAKKRHPHLSFECADALDFCTDARFDFIICSDVVNEFWDAQRVFESLRRFCHPGTRLIINSYNHIWGGPRRVAESLHLVRPLLKQNWFAPADLENLLYLADFEMIRRSPEILSPIPFPGLANFANKYLAKLPFFRLFALTNFYIARPKPKPLRADVVVSVVVAARNEEGNVKDIFDRVPEIGAGTELIFVEGNSKDDTYGAIEREIALRPGRRVKLFKQPGRGKGDAVREGFRNATGELLMILDADLTVPPEDLPRFYDAWKSGKAEFVNGVRLVYPMQDRAMRFFNTIGNKFFSLAFSWLLSQSIKDTLCGTKVLSKHHYEMIAANRAYFGEIDPFGDFDLIFGAARLNLKIVDLPIRYRERTYGETNIQRWSHGWLLLRMVAKAMFKIKFV